MKYAIIKCINGNYFIHAEGYTDISSAKIEFHNLCAALWNEPSVTTAKVIIADENLDCADGYREYITHAAPEPEQVEEASEG